jgi:hypothetical protein
LILFDIDLVAHAIPFGAQVIQVVSGGMAGEPNALGDIGAVLG